jgi:hypothetical protein
MHQHHDHNRHCHFIATFSQRNPELSGGLPRLHAFERSATCEPLPAHETRAVLVDGTWIAHRVDESTLQG